MIGLSIAPALTQPPAPRAGPPRGDAGSGFSGMLDRAGAQPQAPADEDARAPQADAGAGGPEAAAARRGGRPGGADDGEAGENAARSPARDLEKALGALLQRDRRTAAPGEDDGETTAGPGSADDETSGTNDPDAAEADAEAAAAMAGALTQAPLARDQQRVVRGGARSAGDGAAETTARGDAAAAAKAQGAAAEAGDAAGDDADGERGERKRERDGPAAEGVRRAAAGPEGGEMRVRVVSETAMPAPAPAQNQRTVADLAATLAGDREWAAAAERAGGSSDGAGGAPATPVRDLRIQLNPAELGSVDARLRIAGEQLSVEIKVDNAEAYRRLSADRDAIVSALRGLGFAVDDVTIQHQPTSSAQPQPGAGGRGGDASAGLSQGSQGQRNQGGDGSGGQPRGGEARDRNGDATNAPARAAGRGLYI